MEKPEDVTITQITASSVQNARGNPSTNVFGLGSDQRIYYWDNAGHKWTVWASQC